MRGQIILSHGSDSSPDAIKVSTLATLAQSLGWQTQRLDYRQDDALGHVGSVAPRVARLKAAVAALDEPPILVGSSMGAFASGLVSRDLPVAGLFLLATPPEIPGYAEGFDMRRDVPTMLVHGWRDDICPLDPIQRFAGERRVPLLVLDDDHRLNEVIDMIAGQFQWFLSHLGHAA
ncbi:alpha/beta hydrolase [Dyella sp.]|uniref:alpha/beta hydrolase n=1 Tax=Dyella sp. TaxID=1869338 RepID=UPI002ED1D5C3